MSEACEWDPARDAPAVLDGTWHAWAVWSCGTGPRNIHLCQDCADLPRFRRLKRRALARSEEGTMTKRVKKVPPPEPPRDHRLVALAEQAQRVGWEAEWHPPGFVAQWWLRLQNNGVGVDAFVEDGGLSCYPQFSGIFGPPARTPTEALRAAYAALGVALDRAEDAFGGAS